MRDAHDEEVSIIGGFPMPVCRFARAKRCKRFAGEAAFGYDATEKQTFYGFRAHVRIAWPGVIVACELAPANVHDLSMVDELTEASTGYLLGDRNYWSPDVREALAQRGLALVAPEKSRKREQQPWPLSLVQMRRRTQDGLRAVGRALQRGEGLGARPVASGESVVAQGAQPHRGGAAASAAGALTAAFLRTPTDRTFAQVTCRAGIRGCRSSARRYSRNRSDRI